MKVTMYTINNCPFCDQERTYLQTKGVSFEEKNLDQNREFLTEMLAVGNNFKGVPVTKIEKDNGQSVVLKGFTKEEFDVALADGTGQQTPTPPADQPAPPPPSQPEPPVPPAVEPPAPPEPSTPPTPPEPPTPPAPEQPEPQVQASDTTSDGSTPTPPPPEPPTASESPTPPVVEPPAPQPEVPAEPPAPEPPAPTVPPTNGGTQTQANDPLAAILQDLQKKAADTPGPVTPPGGSDLPTTHVPSDQPASPPVAEPPAPTTPEPQTPPPADNPNPSIPDFPK